MSAYALQELALYVCACVHAGDKEHGRDEQPAAAAAGGGGGGGGYMVLGC